MSFSARIKFQLSSEGEAKNLYRILSPEARTDNRVTQSMEGYKSSLSLDIVGMDRRIFRAVTCSYSNWVRIYEKTGGMK